MVNALEAVGSDIHYRCVSCNQHLGPLPSASNDGIAFTCGQCGDTTRFVFGVPCFGHFTEDDTLGLIEIASKRLDTESLNLDSYEVLYDLHEAYHAADESGRKILAAERAMVTKGWFQHSYREWLVINTLCEGLKLRGARVLNVGSGGGFDTFCLLQKGAELTSLDFNPFSLRAAAEQVPGSEWIGGFSHALPFEDDQFDFVFINAALHHMRDITAAIREAARVVAPGGQVVTTADPYVAVGRDVEVAELSTFQRHPMVLGGINEGLLNIGELLEAVESTVPSSVLAISSMLHFVPEFVAAEKDMTPVDGLVRWDSVRDIELLRSTGGAISMRFSPTGKIGPAVLGGRTIGFGDYVDVAERERYFEELTPFFADGVVSNSFPTAPYTKTSLLSGWRRPDGDNGSQEAFRRAVLYRRASDSEVLTVSLRPSTRRSELAACVFRVLVNGEVVAELPATEGWASSGEIRILDVEPGQVYVLEAQFVTNSDAELSFDEELFRVRLR